MSEEETPKPKKRVIPDEDYIAKAQEVAERLEAGNEQLKELLQRQEALNTEDILGGKAVAGDEKPKELDPKEYAKKVMGGHEFEKEESTRD